MTENHTTPHRIILVCDMPDNITYCKYLCLRHDASLLTPVFIVSSSAMEQPLYACFRGTTCQLRPKMYYRVWVKFKDVCIHGAFMYNINGCTDNYTSALEKMVMDGKYFCLFPRNMSPVLSSILLFNYLFKSKGDLFTCLYCLSVK